MSIAKVTPTQQVSSKAPVSAIRPDGEGDLSLDTTPEALHAPMSGIDLPADNPLSGPRLQPKLAIGAVDAPDEREADHIADQVVQRLPLSEAPVHAQPLRIQRKCADCEQEEEGMQVQRKAAGDGAVHASPATSQAIHDSRGGGHRLDHATLTLMQQHLGADLSAVRIHTGAQASALSRNLQARAFTVGQDIFFNQGEYDTGSRRGQHLLAHELVHTVQQSRSTLPAARMYGPTGGQNGSARIQRQPVDAPKTPDEEQDGGGAGTQGGKSVEKVVFEVPIPRNMDQATARKYFEEYIFKGVHVGKIIWTGGSAHYKAQSTTTVRISKSLIDRLHKRLYLEKLPLKVQQLMHYDHTLNMQPENIDKLFALAKRVEGMSQADIAEFASRVRNRSADPEVLEKSLDSFFAFKEKTERNLEVLRTSDTRLTGLENLYRLYKRWKSTLPIPALDPNPKAAHTVEIPVPNVRFWRDGQGKPFTDAKTQLPDVTTTRDLIERQLMAALSENGFGSIEEFEDQLTQYWHSFLQQALSLVMIGLAKYRRTLLDQEKRYRDSTESNALHEGLGQFRADRIDYDKADAAYWHNFRNKPQNPFATERQAEFKKTKDALGKVRADAEAKAEGDLSALAGEHPLLGDKSIPGDTRIDRNKLAAANPSDLGPLLVTTAQRRGKEVDDALAVLEDSPTKLLAFPKAMGMAMNMMGIPNNSIQKMVIQDAIQEYKDNQQLRNILEAVLVISLTILSGGTASPLLAAAAAGGAAALSANIAVREINEYVDQKQMSKVGLADDPSTLWLVVSIVGTALDLGQAVQAIRALTPAAKALSTTDDLAVATAAAARFQDTLTLLERGNLLSAKAARSAAKAMEAELSYRAALKDLRQAAGKVSMNQVFDHEIYTSLTRMAVAKIKQGVYSFGAWLSDLRAQKLIQEADLSGEMLQDLKIVWREAEDVAKAETKADEIAEAATLDPAGMAVADNVVAVDAPQAGKFNPRQTAFKEALDDMEDITDAQRASLMEYNVSAPHGTLDPTEALAKMNEGKTYKSSTSRWVKDGAASKTPEAPFVPTEAEKTSFWVDAPKTTSRDGWKRFMRDKYAELHKQGEFSKELVAAMPDLAPLKAEIDVLLSHGRLDKFNMVRAIRNGGDDFNRTIGRLKAMDELATRGNRGVNQLLGDLAAGGSKQEGAEFVLRVMEDLHLWKAISRFEEVSEGIGRRYDLVAGGKKWEFKSVAHIDPRELGEQFVSDATLLKEQRLLWVFNGEKIGRDEVIGQLGKIIDAATGISAADKALIKGNLHRTVVVY